MARRAKAVHAGGHDNAERWLLTYADMITLLMVFFIVLYAISNTDLRKFTAFAQSVSAAFNTDVFEGTQSITVTNGQETAPDIANYDSGSGVVSSDYRSINATVSDFAISNGLQTQITVDRVAEGIAIRISDSLLFSSGRAYLDDKSRKVLDKIVSIINPLPNPLRIEGHTDDIPPAGPFYSDNWQLSTARALAVLDGMRGSGVAADRLSAAGYAQYKPIVPNTDEASRARNRRVDILILYPPSADSSQPGLRRPIVSIGGLS